jgi:vacuolar-type H+-ATPase subunit C/Vma6
MEYIVNHEREFRNSRLAARDKLNNQPFERVIVNHEREFRNSRLAARDKLNNQPF